MSDEIKPEVIKKTQDSLGKYIKKPPLTEKLLKKPPFRFLHDIITNVIRETGFLQGVFTAEELNHENIKDRDGKIAFLQKIIDAVKTITGVQLTARPSKIVAGHEPAKTNELLQAIGKALDKKERSRTKTIPKTENKLQARDKSKSKDLTKKKSSSSTRISDAKHSKPPGDSEPEDVQKAEEKPGEEANVLGEEKVEEQVTSDSVPRPESAAKEDPEEKPLPLQDTPQPSAEESGSVHPEPLPPPAVGSSLPADKEAAETVEEEGAGEPPPEKSPRKSSNEKRRKSSKMKAVKEIEAAKDEVEINNLRKETETPAEIGVFGGRTTNSEVPEAPTPQAVQRVTSARPKTARPASARPAAPRIRDRGEVLVQEESKPVAGKVNVITDSDSLKEQDEFDNFVVVEAPSTISLDQQDVSPTPVAVQPPVDEGQHGHLVAQILETQKELEDDSQFSTGNQPQDAKHVEIEWEAGQKREKEMASKEVDRLRMSIQTLTRAANPLGKLMDFLQEDVDAMQRELETWRATNNQLKLQLVEEQSLTEESVEPMKIHLQQLEQNILEKLDEISALKATILRNDQKIQRLLNGSSLQAADSTS